MGTTKLLISCAVEAYRRTRIMRLNNGVMIQVRSPTLVVPLRPRARQTIGMPSDLRPIYDLLYIEDHAYYLEVVRAVMKDRNHCLRLNSVSIQRKLLSTCTGVAGTPMRPFPTWSS
jgi:hypothetical protein